MEIEVKVQGERADVIVSVSANITRSHAKKLFDENFVLMGGKPISASKKLKIGDVISVEIPKPETLSVKAEDIPLDIVYQDDDIAVINKPQGMTVHAGNGVKDSTLVNALLFHLDNLSGINGVIRPGIVHRIDKNTSGLLVVAKNDKAHLSLSKQIETKTCKRIYVALVEGVVKEDSGTIDTFIGRNPISRTKMAVLPSGRRAITDFRVLTRFDRYTLTEFSLRTGRTHQIRVHCKYMGHPIVGDPEYGYKNQKFKLNGQLLHAKKLVLIHPVTGKEMVFEAELPDYFKEILTKLSYKEIKNEN